MTKKAFLIILLCILIPLGLTAYLVYGYLNDNPIVAKFGGDVRTINYRGKELHAIPGDDRYKFRFGTYLGKVGDKITGASLYTVQDDQGGTYYAISDGDRSVLFTLSGDFTDGSPADENGVPAPVTRVIVDNYSYVSESDLRIADFTCFETEGETIEFKPSEFRVKNEEGEEENQYRTFVVRYCYGGSAVSRRNEGRLFYFTETKKWVFVKEEKYLAAVAEYGEKSDDLVLAGFEMSDPTRTVNLRAALISPAAEKSGTDAGEQTAAVPQS